jgi:hypothetical protein
MIHEIPELGEVRNIRMPLEYRENPELIKTYLTGFMNAWLLALQIQRHGPNPPGYTLDDL